MITNLSRWISIAVVFALSGAVQPGFAKSPHKDRRPNIVLLVVDDMGYNDLPRYGGEADTPNIDKLAAAGITFNNFHALPTCSPSRAVLLSGVDNHLNGMGTMPDRLRRPGAINQRGQPGYLGYLNDRVVTGPELLLKAGYHTYMAGKWHLAEEETDGGWRRGTWPIDRGFERSTGVLEGGSDQFGAPEDGPDSTAHYFEDDHYLTEGFPPAGFYTTKNYTQKIIEYIDGNKADGKPFFVYWAPNTPHYPHQVPDDYIQKYVARGTYEQGWDAVREQRFNRMKGLGLIPATAALPPRAPNVPAWADETDTKWNALLDPILPYEDVWGITDVAGLKRTLAKDMAVYTAMIDYIDMEIGNLIGHLKEIGEYRNTIFVFISDNGPDATTVTFNPNLQPWLREAGFNNRLENVGRPGSLIAYGPGWAQVSGTPLYSAKAVVGEAGIRVPMIIAYPGDKRIRRNKRSNAFVAVQDILPTILRYAKVKHPAGTRIPASWENCTVSYASRTICPMNGRSMVGLLTGRSGKVHGDREGVGFELFGTVNKALFQERWKILRLGDSPWGAGESQPWKLFNLRRDPLEAEDLSLRFPNRLQRMVSAYERYEAQVGFIPFVGTAPVASGFVPGSVFPETEGIDLRHIFD